MRLQEIREYHEKNPHRDTTKGMLKCKLCSESIKEIQKSYQELCKLGTWNENATKELKSSGETILWKANN